MIAKTSVGAGAGAVFGIGWAAFGFGWACLVLGLTLVGAGIGYVIDRPGGLIEMLQRLQDR